MKQIGPVGGGVFAVSYWLISEGIWGLIIEISLWGNELNSLILIIKQVREYEFLIMKWMYEEMEWSQEFLHVYWVLS